MDKMKLENAPTLGPVMKEWTLAVIDKDYEKAWDLSSISTHEFFTLQLEDVQEDLEEEISSMEDELNDPDISEKDKIEMREQCEKAKKDLEELQAMEGDGKEYFAWIMNLAEEQEGSFAKELAKGKIEIISESIDGNTGHMVSRDLETNEEEKLYFTQEKHGWKVDLTGSFGGGTE